jgi:hypothetical protein
MGNAPARACGAATPHRRAKRAGRFRPHPCNIWRYAPGAKGRRHTQKLQEETSVVLAGTPSMYLGDPPERHDVPMGGLVHVEPGTALSRR